MRTFISYLDNHNRALEQSSSHFLTSRSSLIYKNSPPLMRAIRRKDYVFLDIPTPTDDFPRTSCTTVEHNGPFYPYSDDHKHLAAAARTASRTWTEGGQSAVTPDVYMLAVADKAMEL